MTLRDRDATVSSNQGEGEHITIRGFAKAGDGRMPQDVTILTSIPLPACCSQHIGPPQACGLNRR